MNNKLTPVLNEQQLKQNIDALKAGGMSNDGVQSYVNNYQKSANGYVLKGAQAESTEEVVAEKPGLLKTVGGALISSQKTLAEGATQAVKETGIGKKLGLSTEKATQSLRDSYETQIKNAKSFPAGDPRRTKWLKIAGETAQQLGGQAQQELKAIPTSKEIAGAAAGTLLDVASAGTYGAAAKGAQAGKLLVQGGKSAAAASQLAKVGVKSTAKEITQKAGTELAKKTAGQVVKSGLAKTAGGATLGYGYDISSNLGQNKSGSDIFKPGGGSIVGGGLPLAGLVAKGAGAVAKETAKYVSSGLSGVPVKAMEEAFRNPTAVQGAIKAAIKGENTPEMVYKSVQGAIKDLKKAQQAGYQTGLATLEKETMTNKKGQLYVKKLITKADVDAGRAAQSALGTTSLVPTDLSTKGLKNVATTTLKEFGVKAKGRTLDFAETAIDKSHANKVQEVVDRIYAWKNNTPTGLNNLRKIIDSYKIGGINPGSSEKQFNAIVGSLRKNLSSYVGERVPQVAAMNAEYAAKAKVLDKITVALKANSKDPTTMTRKLVNIFNPKSEAYAHVISEFGEKKAKEIMSDIAGMTMSRWTPEGLGKYVATLVGGGGALLGAPVGAAPGLLAASPRVIGKVTTTAGKASRVLNKPGVREVRNATGKIVRRVTTKLAGQ